MRIIVDLERCTGHGFCEGLAEDVFEVHADGVAHLLDESPGEDRREIVEEAVALCPTRALSIQEALSGQAQRDG